MTKVALRLLLTLLITWIYCCIWIWLEKMIDGYTANRIVDNIIMMLFVPIIYIATDSMIKK